MESRVSARFSDDELALLDDLVAQGIGGSRSEVIRRGVHHLARVAGGPGDGEAIARSYLDRPQPANDVAAAMASATALTDVEPW